MRYITDERKFPTAMEVCHVYSQLNRSRSEHDLVKRTGLDKELVRFALKSLKLQGKSGKPAKATPKLPAMKKTAHRVSTSAPVKAASANPYNYGPSGPAFSGGPSGPMFTGGPSGPAFMGGPSGPMI